jgi:hypothetical protein
MAVVVALILSSLLNLHRGVQALPPAGLDDVHVSADVLVKSRIGTETVHLEGTATIVREDPHDEGGLQVVDFTVVPIDLAGDSLVGHVTATENPDVPSTGQIRKREASQDFPLDAFFDVYLEVGPPRSGFQSAVVLYNETSIHLTNSVDISVWPPYSIEFTAAPTEVSSHCSPSASPPGPGGIALFPPPEYPPPAPGEISGDPLQICITEVMVTLSDGSTPTATSTATRTATATRTSTPTKTNTPTKTWTPRPTRTPTSTAPVTNTATRTSTLTSTPTDTPPATDTPTPTGTRTPTATPTPLADGNANCTGGVDAVDAAVTLQAAAGLIASVPCPPRADVNRDGRVDSLDALLMLQFVAGLLSQLPV